MACLYSCGQTQASPLLICTSQTHECCSHTSSCAHLLECLVNVHQRAGQGVWPGAGHQAGKCVVGGERPQCRTSAWEPLKVRPAGCTADAHTPPALRACAQCLPQNADVPNLVAGHLLSPHLQWGAAGGKRVGAGVDGFSWVEGRHTAPHAPGLLSATHHMQHMLHVGCM